MKILQGVVRSGYGVAGQNLAHVLTTIEHRIGLAPLISGMFNLKLSEPYIVIPDAQIEAHEYNRKEFIKLQRCVVDGVRAIIMRPNTHEDGYAHGPSHIELLSTVVLRETLRVENGSVVDVEVEGDEDWWSRGM